MRTAHVALLLAALVSLVCAAKKDKRGKSQQHQDKNEDEDARFYDIYAAIATMRRIAPEHDTFYSLLGVSPDAPDEEVSRAFRRTAGQWHPDKLGAAADARSEDMSRLVQAVGSLLRAEGGRARYDWVLNDAPPWHFHEVYYSRRGRAGTAKMGLGAALGLLAAMAVAFPALGAWAAWGIAAWRHRQARLRVAGLSERDVRRLRARLDAVAAATLSPVLASEPSLVALLEADGPSPPVPECLGLWPLRLLLWPVRTAFAKLRRPSIKQD